MGATLSERSEACWVNGSDEGVKVDPLAVHWCMYAAVGAGNRDSW